MTAELEKARPAPTPDEQWWLTRSNSEREAYARGFAVAIRLAAEKVRGFPGIYSKDRADLIKRIEALTPPHAAPDPLKE
jgi:hypothetical protein